MTNWDAYSHEQIHKMINDGRGHYALSSRDLLWEKQAERLTRIGDNVKKAFEAATGVMQGKSFDQMQERVSPAHQWATQASTMANTMRSTSQSSTSTFVETQKKIEPAKQVTSSDNFISRGWASLTGGMTDKQREQQDKDNAERKAREIMRGYESTVISSTTNLPTFIAPDPIDVGVGGGSGSTSEVGSSTGTPTRRGSFNPNDPTRRGVVGDRDGDGIPDDRDPRDDRNPFPDKDGDGIPDDRDPHDNRLPIDRNERPIDQFDPSRVVTPTPPPVVNQPVPMPTPGPGGGPSFGPVPIGAGSFGPGGGSPAVRPGMGAMAGVGAAGGPGGAGGFGPGGRGGAPGMGGPMGAGGARANGEEDKEHKRPDYLIETDDIFGDGMLVAPPVIGER